MSNYLIYCIKVKFFKIKDRIIVFICDVWNLN